MSKSLSVLVCAVILVAGCSLLRSGTARESLMPEGQYVVVSSVSEGTEADRVGVKEGDIILSYDGKPVTSVAELNKFKEEVKTDEVELVVLRKDRKETFTIKAGQIGVYLNERRPEIELAEDAVVLKGVGKLGWDTGMSSSFVAALAVTAEYLGSDKDYTYLMGVSGGAFRLHFHKDWCPSSADATVGLDTGAEAMKALGFSYEYHHLAGGATAFGETEEAITDAIMRSIDAGRPVIAIDLIEVPEWGVITGYQSGGSEFLCRTYFDKQEGYSLAEKFPWVVVIITDEKTPPSDEENYKNALRIATEAAKTESFGDYHSGTAALEGWIKRLSMDNFAAMEPDKFEECTLANAWIYARLADDRTYAAKFLNNLVEQFPKYKDPLSSLSAIYSEQVEILKGSEENAPFPYNLAPGETWTGDMRGEEVKALKSVLEKEREAAKLLEQIGANI